MRIIYIIHNLTIGGAETLVTNYLINLKKTGCDVALIQLTSQKTFLSDKLKQNSIPIYTVHPTRGKSVPMRGLSKIERMLLGKYRVNRLIRALNPDIVHCHTMLPYIDKLAIDPKKVFFTFHTAVERAFVYSPRRFQKSLKIASENGGTIVALSQEMKQDVLRYFPNSNVEVILNGVDIRAISSEKYNRIEFLRSMSIPDDAFVVGHVGRFHPVKNHEKLIEIFAEMKKKKSEAYLLLVGSGDLERTEELHKRVRESGLEDCVIFAGERADATKIMSVFDVFLLPSIKEGFSLVLVEAQAHGIRSIVTDSIPNEAIVNPNCFRLSVSLPSEEWCSLALGNQTNTPTNTIESLDIKVAVGNHISAYKQALDN